MRECGGKKCPDFNRGLPGNCGKALDGAFCTDYQPFIEDIDHRRGRFKLHHDLIKDDPGLILKMMAMMIVVRAESLFCEDTIEYHAMSRLFEKVEKGQLIPEYSLEAHTCEEGEVTIEAVKL